MIHRLSSVVRVSLSAEDFQNKLKWSILVSLWLAFLCLPMNIQGQTTTTTTLKGIVTDPQGDVIVGAEVKLVNQATKAERRVLTNADGQYVFANIEPGTYDLVVTAAGFRQALISGIRVQVSREATVNIALEVGGVEEVMEVPAEAVAIELQTTDASVGNVIER
ncbi:MAG: carboxypeptidase regulatory-like domain-containing protein, partial [Acidobacteria bacterium]